MTFNAYETSIAQGEPILLFDFSIGTSHWRYTTADRTITYLTQQYAAVPISRTAPIQSSDIRQQIMTITLPRDNAFASIFSQYPPAGDVLLTITALHYDDTDQQGIVDWTGRVTGAKWANSVVDLSCEPMLTSIQSAGLRRRWGLSCPHVLYGQSCTLSSASFKVVAPIQAISGVAITGAGFVPPSGLSFVGGFIQWDSGEGYFESRTINSVSGTTLTLNYGSPELIVGLNISIYPGCNRSQPNCNAFGNILNFGGQPNIPNKNPMDGSFNTVF